MAQYEASQQGVDWSTAFSKDGVWSGGEPRDAPRRHPRVARHRLVPRPGEPLGTHRHPRPPVPQTRARSGRAVIRSTSPRHRSCLPAWPAEALLLPLHAILLVGHRVGARRRRDRRVLEHVAEPPLAVEPSASRSVGAASRPMAWARRGASVARRWWRCMASSSRWRPAK